MLAGRVVELGPQQRCDVGAGKGVHIDYRPQCGHDVLARARLAAGLIVPRPAHVL